MVESATAKKRAAATVTLETCNTATPTGRNTHRPQQGALCDTTHIRQHPQLTQRREAGRREHSGVRHGSLPHKDRAREETRK
ncbi:uncharacterized protein DS421_8g225900 [Arachis hypogaea]|nr:uncharacterized protein DS421_8g225900 [Arachis hypogaea]